MVHVSNRTYTGTQALASMRTAVTTFDTQILVLYAAGRIVIAYVRSEVPTHTLTLALVV